MPLGQPEAGGAPPRRLLAACVLALAYGPLDFPDFLLRFALEFELGRASRFARYFLHFAFCYIRCAAALVYGACFHID